MEAQESSLLLAFHKPEGRTIVKICRDRDVSSEESIEGTPGWFNSRTNSFVEMEAHLELELRNLMRMIDNQRDETNWVIILDQKVDERLIRNAIKVESNFGSLVENADELRFVEICVHEVDQTDDIMIDQTD